MASNLKFSRLQERTLLKWEITVNPGGVIRGAISTLGGTLSWKRCLLPRSIAGQSRLESY